MPAATSARWAAACSESHFADAGAYIFTLSVLLAGLLLSTDYFLFRAAAVTTSVTGRSLLHVGHFGHVVTQAARVKTDLEDDERARGRGSRRRGRRRRIDEEEGEEEAEDDEEEADEDDRAIKVRTPGEVDTDEESDEADDDDRFSGRGNPRPRAAASKLANGLKAALGLGESRRQPRPRRFP